MADDKYSVDDILKEVDNHRSGGKSKGSFTDENVGDDLDKFLYTGVQKKHSDPLTAKQKPDMSVTQIINSVEKKESFAARQLTDEQADARRARNISDAIDREKGSSKTFEERPRRTAKQLTESEMNARIAKDISNAADVKIYERLTSDNSDSAITKERDIIRPESEYVQPFVKPEVSGEDDIVFHTSGDLVTTETMEMRKQQRIEEINRALLKVESEAETTDDVIEQMNPLEQRSKATDMLKPDSNPTDTLAVAGNDLKNIGKEEHIKEYRPSASRKKPDEPSLDDVLFTPGRQKPAVDSELHVGETIVDALNKKIKEEKENIKSGAQSNSSSDDNLSETLSGKINIIASAPEEPEKPAEENPVEKIKTANELAQKKKRKIAEFVLEDIDSNEEDTPTMPESNPDEYEDEEEEPIDLDDENVIRDRLSRASKGLVSRLIILAVLFAATLFVEIVNAFDLRLGAISSIISMKASPDNYLYTYLTIGILSFAACSSVISNGFSRLFNKRPDGDTLCAFAHTGAIVSIICYLVSAEYIQRGRSHVYVLISLALLCFNTISKICTVAAAKKNMDFISSRKTKYFIEQLDENDSMKLAKGAAVGIPVVASMRKTEMLCDFIVSTYCEDSADRTARKISVVSLIAAVVCGLVAFFTGESKITMNNVSWAVSCATAILAIAAPFSSSMTVTLPLFFAANKAKQRGSAILGYSAIEDFGDTNAVLVDAKSIFPPNSVTVTNICGYDKPNNRSESKVNIDEAIILAASLAVASDSILADALFNMLSYKKELLRHVSGCVFENNLGVMGWIDRRRVLLGNREHMKSHDISVPKIEKEDAANVNHDDVIYLAVGGEVCLLFFVHLNADPTVSESIYELSKNDISLVVKTVDGTLTADSVCSLFNLEEGSVKILPFEAHECFNEHTKFTTQGSAALSCDGTFPAFAKAISTVRNLGSRISLGNILQVCGIGLGILLALIFILVRNYSVFGIFSILIYNTAWAVITLGGQFLKKL